VDGTGNMPGIIKKQVFVRLDDSNVFVVQMLLEPIGIDKGFWVRVLRGVRSHRTGKFRPLLEAGKRICANLEGACRGRSKSEFFAAKPIYFLARISSWAKRNEY